ncbi:response regulator [Gracilinema caldarium]|uniref:Response regulator receiver protein n=1 Tax=Gracilinema caldarium (strain ATCC 51460 / DSM 7334 / H1) TaxID=744872 RepID=F8F3W1_GRAC1|nr:response regulator [Gracilinema caldarium]AEJ20480.1 response regulator receiver protein [Gracilinema caldarium DSM 7334]
MKHIIIIDESPLLREYLRIKLSTAGLEVSIAINGLDGIAKIRNNLPDLVIIDYNLSRQSCIEVLKEKKKNPNTASIPVIVMAQKIDQKKIIELVQYNVKKVFTKPIKIDALFATLSELLQVSFDIDDTPSIIETHVNDNILFIEIAKGLNREKLDLLRFRILELIDLYDIKVPKVIVMMSDIKLSFADGTNLQKLLDTVIQASRAKLRHIRILTNDDFVKNFIKGRKEYDGIEVTTNLQYALEGLLAEMDGSIEFGEKKAEIISEKVLQAETNIASESVMLKFDTEVTKKTVFTISDMRERMEDMQIATVDDDFVIQELLKSTFEQVGAHVDAYPDGESFLNTVADKEYDLVFLDLLMPKVDGFKVLQELKVRDIRLPIIVLSAVTQRDSVIRAFQAGVKSYLIKPLQPIEILKKTIEVVRPII